MIRQHKYSGFTLVELMIAMTFVTFLLLVIAGFVIQMSNIYSKGLTMMSVNKAGRAVVDDMRRTVGASKPFDLTKAYISQDGPSLNNPAINRQKGGRFCTGAYTYVWNIGTEVKTDSSGKIQNQENKYESAPPSSGYTPLRFVRLQDVGGHYCAKNATGAFEKPIISKPDATELFSDNSIMVQCFQINTMQCNSSVNNPPTYLTKYDASGQQLYFISMLISNADKEAIDSSDSCKKPSDDAAYQNYCAVNEFDFTLRSGNNGG